MSQFSRPRVLSLALTTGQSFVIKNTQGFTVFSVNEAGDIARKGKDVKLA